MRDYLAASPKRWIERSVRKVPRKYDIPGALIASATRNDKLAVLLQYQSIR